MVEIETGYLVRTQTGMPQQNQESQTKTQVQTSEGHEEEVLQ